MTRPRADKLVVERRTLDGVIHDVVRARIISLEYPPGRMIFENDLAAEFGVSRTPVRQAFLRLAMEDLLQILPQRGAQVSHLSRSKVREAQAVRESLEATAFQDVARRWREDDPGCQALVAEAEAIIARQVAAVAARDYMVFTRLDEDFHNAFLHFSGNMTLAGIVAEMRGHLNRLRYMELQEAHHDAVAVEHHRAILAAVRRGDVEATHAALIAHLKMLEPYRETIFDKHSDVFI